MRYEQITVKASGYTGELTCYEHTEFPELPVQSRPALLVLPGGGYAFCSDREGEPVALEFFARGYNVYVVKYPVVPARYPAQLAVAAAAMDTVRKRASGCKTDVHKVFAMGFSAGAHLCGCLANCPDGMEVTKGYDFRPDGIVLSYPVIFEIGHLGSFQNLLGDRRDKDTEWLELHKSVRDDNPPAFIWATATDNCVSPLCALRYAEAYAEKKLPYELHIYPEGVHGLSLADSRVNKGELSDEVRRAADWVDYADAFLRHI